MVSEPGLGVKASFGLGVKASFVQFAAHLTPVGSVHRELPGV